MNLRPIKRLLQEQNDVLCLTYKVVKLGFPHSSIGKNSACNAGDLGLIPGSGRSSGEGNGKRVQYSCLENPMDTEAWLAAISLVAHSCQILCDPMDCSMPGFPVYHQLLELTQTLVH